MVPAGCAFGFVITGARAPEPYLSTETFAAAERCCGKSLFCCTPYNKRRNLEIWIFCKPLPGCFPILAT